MYSCIMYNIYVLIYINTYIQFYDILIVHENRHLDK